MKHGECVAYIHDLGLLIKEKALEAKEAKNTSMGKANHDFAIGRLMAFHEIDSLMQQQADAFGLTLEEIGLADIDPEKTLL